MDRTLEDDKEFSDWIDETFRLRGITDETPSRVFKFMSSESKYFPLVLHELFLHNRIYLSSRRDFNDPLDSSFGLDFPKDPSAVASFVEGVVGRSQDLKLPEDYLRQATDNIAEFAEKTGRRLSAILDEMGIYSVSDQVSHPLMWAHYAGSHRGISVFLRFVDPDKNVVFFPIRYQAEYPRAFATGNGLEVYYLLTKGGTWRYESEWRIVESHKARTWKAIPPNVLGGVIFGARASRETYEFVWDLVMRRADAGLPPVAVVRAVIGESFELSFQEFMGEDQWGPVEFP